jgi:hypothetical protein
MANMGNRGPADTFSGVGLDDSGVDGKRVIARVLWGVVGYAGATGLLVGSKPLPQTGPTKLTGQRTSLRSNETAPATPGKTVVLSPHRKRGRSDGFSTTTPGASKIPQKVLRGSDLLAKRP